MNAMTPLLAALLAELSTPSVIKAVGDLAAIGSLWDGVAKLIGNRRQARPPGRPQPPARPASARRGQTRSTSSCGVRRRNSAAQPQAGARNRRRSPSRRSAPAGRANRSRPKWLPTAPVGGQVTEHVKKYLDAEAFDSRAGQLGQDVTQTVDREIDQHLHQVFDHSVSRLAAMPGESASAAGGRGAGRWRLRRPMRRPRRFFRRNAMDLVAVLSSADLIRQAIVLNELFRRPEERWG